MLHHKPTPALTLAELDELVPPTERLPNGCLVLIDCDPAHSRPVATVDGGRHNLLRLVWLAHHPDDDISDTLVIHKASCPHPGDYLGHECKGVRFCIEPSHLELGNAAAKSRNARQREEAFS